MALLMVCSVTGQLLNIVPLRMLADGSCRAHEAGVVLQDRHLFSLNKNMRRGRFPLQALKHQVKA